MYPRLVVEWVTVLAAGGGVMLGIGLGLAFARKRLAMVALRARRDQARLRASVVPVLEARAQQLGIPQDERQSHADDPVDVAVGLSVAIMRIDGDPNLAFSDTVELARAELDPRKKKGAGGG